MTLVLFAVDENYRRAPLTSAKMQSIIIYVKKNFNTEAAPFIWDTSTLK